MANRTPLNDSGFLRLRQVLEIYPVSRSTWWQMVSTGRAPQPVKLGLRAVAWRVRDIRELTERVGAQSGGQTPEGVRNGVALTRQAALRQEGGSDHED